MQSTKRKGGQVRRTLIIGPADAGKSSVALLVANTFAQEPSELANGAIQRHTKGASFDLKQWHPDTMQDQLWDTLCTVSADTDVLIFENIPFDGLQAVITFFTNNETLVCRDNGDCESIHPAGVIMTCDCDLKQLASMRKASYLHRYLVLNCGSRTELGTAAMIIDPAYFSNQSKLNF